MIHKKARFWTAYDKVQQEEKTDIINNLKGKLYAVLFNGNEGRHSYDVGLTYTSLINSGVDDKDIGVLEGDGKTKNRFVDRPATVKDLECMVDKVRQKSTTNDRLLVYVTNHGILENGQCGVQAHDGIMWEKDFEKIMQDIPVNFGVYYFSQCFSGGFAERMGYENNIGISSTNKKTPAYGTGKKTGSDFTNYLFPNILKSDHTIEEAFDKAVKCDTWLWYGALCPGCINSEIPQLRYQNAIPSELFLGSLFTKEK
jgi:hypothetical protein